MRYSNILFDVKDQVATITLNQPEKRNRLANQTLWEIIDALEKARNDNGVKVIIVTGTGDKAFCAGADINEFIGNTNLVNREQYEAYAKLCTVFSSLGRPSIAAVRGWRWPEGVVLPSIRTSPLPPRTQSLGPRRST